MTDQAAAINRARHLERMRKGRLELWRIRGQVARAVGDPRRLPALGPRASIDLAAKAKAWLAGYDGQAARRIA